MILHLRLFASSLALVTLLAAPAVLAQQAPLPATPVVPATPVPPAASSSDLIIKRTGEEVAAHIVEVMPDVVKYHRADNPQGPLFSTLTAEIFMVRYANGTKQVFAAPRAAQAANPVSTLPVLAPRTPEDSIFAPLEAGGPRIGFTVVGNGRLRDRLRNDYSASNVVTQFGWQFETRLFRLPSGVSGLFEFVPLIGGLEQGLFLPSASGILGIRGANGLEFGFGPNLSLAGAGLAVAAGTTIQGKYVNVPINLAMVPGRQGNRFSLLIGFTYRRNQRY